MKKTFYLTSDFTTKSSGSKSKTLQISGYANTVDKDRTNDVILPSAWAKGVENYRKNPVLLFQHHADKPIGKVDKIKIDPKGIFVEATISEVAEKQHGLHTLIKDGAVKAFSVGFRPFEGDYDQDTDVTTISEVELLEVSVVSIPANQNSLFSIRKNFSSEEEYKDFCKQFTKKEEEKLLVGTTSVDNDHYHAYELDDTGNGRTTYTSHGHTSHFHDVVGKVITDKNDHSHQIRIIDTLQDKELIVEEVSAELEIVTSDIKSEELIEVELSDNIEEEETDLIEVELNDEEEIGEIEDEKPIPFINLLNSQISNLELNDVVLFDDTRWIIQKIATIESSYFIFKDIDIDDNYFEINSDNLTIINDFNDVIELGYFNNNLVEEKKKDDIVKTFTSLINITNDTKNKIYKTNNLNHIEKLDKILNLKNSVKDWTEENYIIANNICNIITYLTEKILDENNTNSNYKLALELYGHEVQSDDMKEKNEMGEQIAGDPITIPEEMKVAPKKEEVVEVKETPTETPVTVAEPQVAELLERTAKALELASKREQEADSKVEELTQELSQSKEQIAALTKSKMVYEQNQRSEKWTPEDYANAYFLAKAYGKPDNESIFDTKLGRRMKADVTSVSAFLTNFSTVVQGELEQELIIAPMLRRIQIDAKTFHVPIAAEAGNTNVAQIASGTYASSITDTSVVPASNRKTIASVAFAPHKWVAVTHLAKDEEEDTLLPLLPFLRAGAARSLARSIDNSLLRGDGSLTGATLTPVENTVGNGFDSVISGISTLANDISGLRVTTASSSTKATPADIASARAKLGKYGIRVGTDDLVYITSVEGYNELVQTADFRTVDTFGSQATYHTGTIGAIYGIPVVISEFMDNVASGAHLGVLVYKPGFLIAERRGITVESNYEPAQQVTAIYISTRLDMHAMSANSSNVLDATTWSLASVIKAAA